MRFVATRRELPGELGIGSDDIPAKGGRPAYSVRCDFTNIPAPDATVAERTDGLETREGEENIRLAHERCGQGEAVHSMLKNDLAAGILPSGRLGPNAAWLQAAAIPLNVVALVRMAAMGTDEADPGGMDPLCRDDLKAGASHDAGSAFRSPASGDSTQPPRRFARSAVDRSGGLVASPSDRPFRIFPPSVARRRGPDQLVPKIRPVARSRDHNAIRQGKKTATNHRTDCISAAAGRIRKNSRKTELDRIIMEYRIELSGA